MDGWIDRILNLHYKICTNSLNFRSFKWDIVWLPLWALYSKLVFLFFINWGRNQILFWNRQQHSITTFLYYFDNHFQKPTTVWRMWHRTRVAWHAAFVFSFMVLLTSIVRGKPVRGEWRSAFSCVLFMCAHTDTGMNENFTTSHASYRAHRLVVMLGLDSLRRHESCEHNNVEVAVTFRCIASTHRQCIHTLQR